MNKPLSIDNGYPTKGPSCTKIRQRTCHRRVRSRTTDLVNANNKRSLIFVDGFNSWQSMSLDAQGESRWFVAHLPRLCAFVRAFVFDYQQQTDQMDPIDTVDWAARTLLSLLEDLELGLSHNYLNQSTTSFVMERPLLFICNSLGSIVVKKALILAKTRNDRPSLASRVYGMICLGSPHAKDARDWADALKDRPISADANVPPIRNTHTGEARRLAKKLANTLWLTDSNTRTSRKRRYQNLPKYFSDICESFNSMGSLYTNVYFCHDRNSSCHPAALLHEHCLWSMSSQSRIARYEEMHYIIPPTLSRDIKERNVELAILSLSEAAARDSRERHTWIRDQQALRMLHGQQRLCRTTRWLWEHGNYQAWANAEGPFLLWLHGAPGTGKSTICSALLDSIQTRESKSECTFFCFFDECLGGRDPAQFVLRTLIYQIGQYQQCLVPDNVLRSTLRSFEKLTGPLTAEMFRDNLNYIFANIFSHRMVFLLIDGVDGNDWVKNIVIEEITHANSRSKRSCPIRCIISTRDRYSAILYQDQVTRLDLDSAPGLRQDILEYTLSWLTDLPQKLLREKSATTSVANELCSRANGNFLWAALAIEDMTYMDSSRDLVDEIRSIPASVEGLFQRRLKAIPSSNLETTRTVFSWLIGAKRLLCLSDLQEALEDKALVYSLARVTPLHPSKLKIQISKGDISGSCGRLVIFAENDIVRFRHESVRDYLLYPNKPSPHDRTLEAHELIAKTCLRYLLNSTESDRTAPSCLQLPSSHQFEPSSIPSLAQYAMTNWSFHYSLAESHSRVLAGLLQRHLSIRLDNACEFLSIKQSQRSLQTTSTILRFSAYCGFAALGSMSLEMGGNPDGDVCGCCETPLTIATARYQSDAAILRSLLRKGAAATYDTNGKHDLALWIAASEGLLDAVELNLLRGADTKFANGSGETSLHIAARLGNVPMVKLLMRYKADVNAVTSITSETPLHYAAVHGHLAIAKCLVDGQNASTREKSLYQSINQEPSYQHWTNHLLATNDQTKCFVWEMDARNLAEHNMQELLSYSDRYTNINKQSREGLTPLHLAASKGHDEVVQFLLTRGAILQSPDDTRRTALQQAAENGHIDTVRLLIQAGGNLKLEGDMLGSMIRDAYARGHEDIASLLLFHSYSFEITGKACHWPTGALVTQNGHNVVRDAKTENRT